MKWFTWFFILCAVSVLIVSGCATAPVDNDSEIPWNTPQPWEGNIMVPGMDAME